MVSVLIPAYNAEKTINRCIESILHKIKILRLLQR